MQGDWGNRPTHPNPSRLPSLGSYVPESISARFAVFRAYPGDE
jgi:hypothetical protein